MRWRAVSAALILSTVAPLTARAQQADAPAPAPPPPTDAAKADARAHFDKGLELLRARSWDEALAEFIRSEELFSTKASGKNAAVCLRQLKRYDEALDQLEAVVRAFPNITGDERAAMAHEMDELRGLVGTLEVRAGQD